MTTYRNLLSQNQTIIFIADPKHYEQGHVCDGTCATQVIDVAPGSTFSYDETQGNGPDIHTQCENAGLANIT